ncbi:phytanoyl-CoA dioxygenase family protein [Ilumatobacter sp.]|uniref:phytanoyl-CoA dioxygenase family protein n=1 Tax=Ilumatobacter sp. TaxID=1967498 RepID=UPI003C47E1BB
MTETNAAQEFGSPMYRAEVTSREPMASVLASNPEIYFVPPKRSAEWGEWEYRPGSYYDTTTGSKHPDWKDVDLPIATNDIERLRRDFVEWGYCKVDRAIAPDQVADIRERVLEQAEGERLAGIAQKTQSGQNINCCVNKGRCFEGLIEHDPTVVQRGPLVEQLVDEALGPGWICSSLIAAIAVRGGVPQALHQDQGIALDSRHPLTINLLTPITDVDEENGGTLLIPGSHRVLTDAVRAGAPVGKLGPAINLDAEAGTMVIIDGRVLHGTGINRTDTPRIVMLNAMQVGWLRQQENWMLSVRPEVIERASPKLLHRMGFQATTYGQTNEGHGFGALGAAGEAAGALVDFRLAADRGDYVRVGELGPDSTPEALAAPFTLREVVATARSGGKSAPLGIGETGPT